jgi:hypothetical protein
MGLWLALMQEGSKVGLLTPYIRARQVKQSEHVGVFKDAKLVMDGQIGPQDEFS